MMRHMLMATATAIALGLSANHAIAHSATDAGKRPHAHRVAHSASPHGSREAHRLGAPGTLALRQFMPPRPPSWSARWPGYTYVPGKGIVDEACNLPTSACPNEMRDIR